MKIHKKNIKFLTILILLSCLLTSCSTSADVSTSAEADSTQLWTANFYTLEDDISYDYFTIWNGYIYYSLSGEEYNVSINSETGLLEEGPTRYYRLKIGSDEEPEELNLNGVTETYTHSAYIQPDNDGNVYIYYGTKTLSKYDQNGDELYVIDTSDYAEVFPVSMTVDRDGNLYLNALKEIYLFNADCTYKGTIACEDRCSGFVNIGDKVYCISFSGDKLSEISFDSVSLVNEISTYPLCSNLTGYMDSGVLGTSDGNIYLFDFETENIEELLRMESYGVKPSNLMANFKLGLLEDGSIVVVFPESDEIMVLKKDGGNDKQVITIGTFDPSTSLQNQVAEFNRNSDDCQVVIKQYYDTMTDNTIGGTGYQEAITKFHLDIMSGNCPDILNLSYDEITTYVDKGLFENLTPYLEESGLDVMENIVRSYTFDGALAAIPSLVQMRTIVGRSKDIENITGWTLTEMMEYVKSNPNETIFNVSASKMLEYCLKFNQSKFIDWENYTCSFESEEFYELLEFCGHYNGYLNSVNTPISTLADYESVLYEVTLTTPSDYLVLRQLLEEDEITFVGFPTDSGTGTVIEEKDGSYAISSKSSNKEAAWEFIEFLLTAETKFERFSDGYPVIKETRDAFFADAASEPWVEVKSKYEDEVTIERRVVASMTRKERHLIYYAPFEEELAPVISLLDNAEVPVYNDITILDIILENAADYFSGEKTVQEAAKQIQSRVTIYINEKK